MSSLREGSSAPPIEFADAQRWLHDAEASVAADQAALSFTQKALDDTEIVAPIDGKILTKDLGQKQGTVLRLGDTLCEVGGMSGWTGSSPRARRFRRNCCPISAR